MPNDLRETVVSHFVGSWPCSWQSRNIWWKASPNVHPKSLIIPSAYLLSLRRCKVEWGLSELFATVSVHGRGSEMEINISRSVQWESYLMEGRICVWRSGEFRGRNLDRFWQTRILEGSAFRTRLMHGMYISNMDVCNTNPWAQECVSWKLDKKYQFLFQHTNCP